MDYTGLGSVSFLDKLAAVADWIWGKLNIDILWEWLPNDIQSWIGTFIVVLFLLAIRRALVE